MPCRTGPRAPCSGTWRWTSITGRCCSRHTPGSSSGNGSVPGNALDGNTQSVWRSSGSESSGQWFQVDFGANAALGTIELDSGTNYPMGFPKRYAVFLSQDGVNWGAAVASGISVAQKTMISFPAQVARFCKVQLTGAGNGKQWTVAEFTAYPPTG